MIKKKLYENIIISLKQSINESEKSDMLNEFNIVKSSINEIGKNNKKIKNNVLSFYNTKLGGLIALKKDSFPFLTKNIEKFKEMYVNYMLQSTYIVNDMIKDIDDLDEEGYESDLSIILPKIPNDYVGFAWDKQSFIEKQKKEEKSKIKVSGLKWGELQKGWRANKKVSSYRVPSINKKTGLVNKKLSSGFNYPDLPEDFLSSEDLLMDVPPVTKGIKKTKPSDFGGMSKFGIPNMLNKAPRTKESEAEILDLLKKYK